MSTPTHWVSGLATLKKLREKIVEVGQRSIVRPRSLETLQDSVVNFERILTEMDSSLVEALADSELGSRTSDTIRSDFVSLEALLTSNTKAQQLDAFAKIKTNVYKRLTDQWAEQIALYRSETSSGGSSQLTKILKKQIDEFEAAVATSEQFITLKHQAFAERADEKTKELEVAAKAFDDTIERYGKQEENLDRALAKASQVGLEKAFDSRASILRRQKTIWVAALFASLLCMFVNASILVYSLPNVAGQTVRFSTPASQLQATAVLGTAAAASSASNGKASGDSQPAAVGSSPSGKSTEIKNSEQINWGAFAARLLLTLPLVWAAWFCAKQYGYASRLEEDYAFKVVVARSYQGYKDEATAKNPELQARLLELTLTTFNENPLRIYNISSDAGTPFQEITESLGKLNSLAEAIGKSKS